VSSEQSDRRSKAFTAASVPDHYEQRLAPVVFEPWARILIDAVGIEPGCRVLDVASGTGAVARAAAHRAGPDGQLVATDVSEPMLARSAARPAPPGSAPIEYRPAPADELPFADASFDVVLCQQGLQFFPDRAAAAREMRRVLRVGGAAAVSVWAAGHRLEPFDEYSEALVAAGVEPPFPRAFENASFAMSVEDTRSLLAGAGFSSVSVSVVEYAVTFADAAAAAAGIRGTPFGPVVEGLAPDRRAELEAELARRFAPAAGGTEVSRTTVAVVARASAA
jgi:ubiquinone/menaquinone biosynthesis C-methylase UbiE